MSCRKYEKWLSDALDGELKKKREERLAIHLEKCASCRLYKDRLGRIQEEAPKVEMARISPDYWDEFSRRISKKLATTIVARKAVRPAALPRRWAWAGASFLFLLAVLLSFLFLRQRQAPDLVPFTYEACLDSIYGELGDDAEAANIFNSDLMVAIGESSDVAEQDERLLFSLDPFFWESLSEEEMRFLEEEIRKELKI